MYIDIDMDIDISWYISYLEQLAGHTDFPLSNYHDIGCISTIYRNQATCTKGTIYMEFCGFVAKKFCILYAFIHIILLMDKILHHLGWLKPYK